MTMKKVRSEETNFSQINELQEVSILIWYLLYQSNSYIFVFLMQDPSTKSNACSSSLEPLSDQTGKNAIF
ncbi:8061_t:CDS:2 [Entrophospora sp. SA101]|nr:8061_t:CDS:2 [Entrophospora sp. SA101]